MPNKKSDDASHTGRSGASRFDGKTRIRLRALAGGAADCSVNVLILFVFAYIGTIPTKVPVQILTTAVLLNTIFFIAIASGLTRKSGDPAITWAQVLAACGANLVTLLLAPQICYMFLFNLFVYLSFGSLYFDQRQFVKAWIMLALAITVVLTIVGGELGIAYARTSERFLFWLILTTALGRVMLINVAISGLRARLHLKNRELAAVSDKLNILATHDELTGLWNRREFMSRLQDESNRVARSGAGFSVAVLDVDLFKSINDRFGHLTGDAVLRELAVVLGVTHRASDVLARYGGEEFTLLFIDSSSEMSTAGLERMRHHVEQHDWTTIVPGLKVTISAGLANWSAGETATQVLGRADDALYLAKHAGRNCIRLAQARQDTPVTAA